jgi:hypothetical protein
MTKIELLELLTRQVKEYRKSGVLESLARNRHMNQYEGEKVSGQTIDAILVDLINFIAARQGVDYGLYTSDLDKE